MLQSLPGKRKRGGPFGIDRQNANGDAKKIKKEIVQLKEEETVQATAAQIVQPKADQAPHKAGRHEIKKTSQELQRELLFDQASAIVRPDNSFLNDQNAKAQAAGSLYERNTTMYLYQYREWRIINGDSQLIADKLRELSNAQKLLWFNIYDKEHRKRGELYYKQLFKHKDIAPRLSRLAAARPPKARKAPLVTPEMRRTKEEQIRHHYPGLRVLNQQAQAGGSTYERNTFQKKLLGYTFLPRGNAYLTRRARELSNATLKIWFNVHCSNYGTLPRMGLLVQDSILVTAKRCEEETREYRESLRAKRNAAKDSEEKTDQIKAKETRKKLPAEIPKKDCLAKEATRQLLKVKRHATKDSKEKTSQTKATEETKKLPGGISAKDRLAKGNSVAKEVIGQVLKAKKNFAEGSGEKTNHMKAKGTVKKLLPLKIPKKDRLAKDIPVAKEIIDLLSDDEGQLPIPTTLEPTAHGDESSDEELSVDSAEFDSDWDPEKDDVEGVLVGGTYEHENGPRIRRSQRLSHVLVHYEEEEDEGEEEDEELRRLESGVKHEPDGDDERMLRQAPGVREHATALVPTEEVHAQIKA
ncbi:hypothetical protein BGX38DRAFT_1191379 [Terfezia claveryi]|nr:hypothetical protein BGX38DRAFT_1191379 [Terfezia claveryi]